MSSTHLSGMRSLSQHPNQRFWKIFSSISGLNVEVNVIVHFIPDFMLSRKRDCKISMTRRTPETSWNRRQVEDKIVSIIWCKGRNSRFEHGFLNNATQDERAPTRGDENSGRQVEFRDSILSTTRCLAATPQLELPTPPSENKMDNGRDRPES